MYGKVEEMGKQEKRLVQETNVNVNDSRGKKNHAEVQGKMTTAMEA